MTAPRAVFPGRFLMVTRRCTQRQFLLRPDDPTSEAFVYCLGEAANKFGIDILLSQMMSNHEHTLLYDAHGNEVSFRQRFHRNVAVVQNASLGRWENFWAAESSCVVEVLTIDDVLNKLLYIATNPVKDGLVSRVHHWPGPNFLHALLSGQPMRARRPDKPFSSKGVMPPQIELAMKLPDHLNVDEKRYLLDGLRDGVAEFERECATKRHAKGRRVLGRSAVRRQCPFSRPASKEPRRDIKPTVASRSKWLRIAHLQRNKEWQLAYRAAREAWLAGIPVEFPYGTYWLARHAGVRVKPPPC